MIKKHFSLDKTKEELTVVLKIPTKVRGTYTYDPDIEFEVDSICVWIDNSRYEFALFHTQYLDYKDSLQATAPIFYFDSEEEALGFAKEYNLMVEYGREHDFDKSEDN